MDIEEVVTLQKKHIRNQKKQLEGLRSRVEKIEALLGQVSNSSANLSGQAGLQGLVDQTMTDQTMTDQPLAEHQLAEQAADFDPRFRVTRDLSDHASHQMMPEFLSSYQRALQHSRMQDNAIRRERFFHLVQLLRLTQGVPGATAEAGVFRGCSSFLTCEELKREAPDFDGSSHFMIDSFEGLSEPVEKDGEYPTKRFAESAFTNTSLESVRETMSVYPQVNIYKGWIPEVFQQLPDKKFRFVHVDVDVYEPTLASLRYFFPKLAAGGAILCDDYGPWKDNNWPGCIRAVEEFSQEIGQQFFVLDSGNVFFLKR